MLGDSALSVSGYRACTTVVKSAGGRGCWSESRDFHARARRRQVRIQTQPGFPATLRKGFPIIMQQEGWWGFYKGVAPLWARQIPYTMMKFACFERTVEALYQ